MLRDSVSDLKGGREDVSGVGTRTTGRIDSLVRGSIYTEMDVVWLLGRFSTMRAVVLPLYGGGSSPHGRTILFGINWKIMIEFLLPNSDMMS